MMGWFKQNSGKKKEFAFFWCIMIMISLCVSFYINFKFNRMTIGGHVYIVDEIKDNSWHFTSETGQNITVSNGKGREIFWSVDDLTLSIGEDNYKIYKEYDNNYNVNYYIDLNGEQVNVSRLSSLIKAKQTPILTILIVFYVFFTTLTCINMVYPELSWKIRMIFVTRGGEPTALYLGMIRTLSIILWIIVILGTATIV